MIIIAKLKVKVIKNIKRPYNDNAYMIDTELLVSETTDVLLGRQFYILETSLGDYDLIPITHCEILSYNAIQ